jgi:hypothetical protein
MRTIIGIAATVALIVAGVCVTLGLAWGLDADRLASRLVTDISPFLSTPLGKVRAYEVACATTAGGTSLGDGEAFSSLYVWINSATPVYIGGTNVDATHGMPFCTASASCPSAVLSMDAKLARCLSSSGTVTAIVLAGAQ